VPPPSAKSNILLIDDDPAVCEALRRVLVVEGWNVVTAKSGEEALERLQDVEPDLMITDLCM
jgi:CheY-like chemotaxis protein